MNPVIRLFSLGLLLLTSTLGVAQQDTLPNFSLRNLGANRIVVGWTNPFPNIKQISIQRSHDSLRNFKTILSVADPHAVQNGFADTKAPNDHMFYRIFYVLDGGNFYFSPSKRPVLDTTRPAAAEVVENMGVPLTPLTEAIVKKAPAYVPSRRVFTNPRGYVSIRLPDAQKQEYSLKFFAEGERFLFEIPEIKEKELTLDKANFLHAGWYWFELYNGAELVERHRFYVAKDF